MKSVSAFLSLAPKFGIWSPQLNWGVQKQWLDLETTDGLLKMNKPMFTGAFNNTFNFNHGWMASVEMNYQSKGDMENYSETKNIFYVDAGVTKFFWGDRMSVKLSGTDLFHGMKSGNRMYYNRASSLQINNYDSRKVMLTVRYKFMLRVINIRVVVPERVRRKDYECHFSHFICSYPAYIPFGGIKVRLTIYIRTNVLPFFSIVCSSYIFPTILDGDLPNS